MKIIFLIGLMAIEKIELAVLLAEHFSAQGAVVAVVDNVRRMAIDPVLLGGETLIRTKDDLTQPGTLLSLLRDIGADVVLVVVGEDAPPERLFVAVEDVRAALPNADVHTLGLLDLRTCDCFPQTRETLEAYADTTLLAPFSLEAALGAVRYDQ